MCGKQRRLAAAGTRSFGDYARTDQFVAVVPCGVLSGRDAPLGLVEEDVGALVAHEERRVLKRLAVADADATLNNTMSLIKCKRRFNKEDCLDLETLNNDDFNSILHSGYELEGFIKMFFKKEEAFSTMFFMNQAITKEELIHATQSIFNDSECGKVFRIKGFIPENDQWIELNAAKDQITTETIAKGQEIIIVIGESLNKEKIEEYIKKPA